MHVFFVDTLPPPAKVVACECYCFCCRFAGLLRGSALRKGHVPNARHNREGDGYNGMLHPLAKSIIAFPTPVSELRELC